MSSWPLGLDPGRKIAGGGGLQTSTLVLGCARLGSALTPLSPRDSVALVEQAFELGVRHFDTASIYGQGDSERYIGQALHRHRGKVCLSSKAGQRLTARQAMLSSLKTPIRWIAARQTQVRTSVAAQRAQGVPRCFEPDFIERSLNRSLERLRTDHLDIFYLHSPDVSVLEDEALLDRIERLRAQGLFRAFGVSCDEEDVAWAAASMASVQVVQLAYDESARGLALLALLARNGKQAMLRGLMHGAGGQAHRQDLLVGRMAQLLQEPALGGLIVGTTRLQHLRENVGALQRALAAEVTA